MLDFLRQLAPRQADALQPASPLRRMAGPATVVDGIEAQDNPMSAHDEVAYRPGVRPLPPIVDRQPPIAGEAPRATLRLQPEHVAHADWLHGEANATTQPLPVEPAAAHPDSPGSMAPPTHAIEPLFAPSDDLRQPLLTDAAAIAQASANPPAVFTVAAPISPATVTRFVQEHASPAPPPAIHVSIDRIEVRARTTAPAPAPSKPRVARESQSLHDYLRGKAAP